MVAPLALNGANDVTTASVGSAASVTANKPTATADGDLLVAAVMHSTGGTTLAAPSGWLTLTSQSTARTTAVFAKAIPTASAETATTYVFTAGATGRITVVLFRVTGADLTAPFGAVSAFVTASGASAVLPSVTPSTSSDLLVDVWNALNATTTASVVTPPAGQMTVGSVTSAPGSSTYTLVSAEALTSSAATGTRTGTMSPTTSSNASYQFTLRPAATASSASGAASLSLTGSGSAGGAGGGAGGSLSLTGAGAGAVTPAGSGALTLSGAATGAGGGTAAGTASLTLSGVGAAAGGATATGTASLTLAGSGSGTPPVNAATLTLNGAGTSVPGPAFTPPTGPGNVTTGSGTTGATATVAKPANLADGDALFLVVFNQVAGTVTTPAGFTHDYHAVATNTRTFYVFHKAITNAGTEPASYSATMSQSASRWIAVAFRLPGLTSAVIDALPASDTYPGGSPTTITDPAITAVAGDALALAFNFTNNSTAVYPALTAAGWTNLARATVDSGTGSTSVVDVEWRQLQAAGSTGAQTFTMSPAAQNPGGFLLTVAPAPIAAAGGASLTLSGLGAPNTTQPGSGAAVLTLGGSGTAVPNNAAAGSAALTLAGAGAVAGQAAGTATLTFGASGSTVTGALAAWLLKSGPRYTGHRDGFYGSPQNLGEFTIAGFNALKAWSLDVAWNIDVWKTTDGEWVASHDQTTGRVLSGTSLDIPTSTWTSISGKTTLVGGNPVARIDDIVAVAPPGTIFFVDNKQNGNTTAFFAKLASLGLSPANVVNKNAIGSTAMLTAARANGYTTWGYVFDTTGDLSNLANNVAYCTWIGFDYTASQASWNTVVAYGKPNFAHVLPNAAAQATADSKAAAAGGSNFGYMVSGISATVPPAGIGAGSLTLTGSGTASANSAGTATLSLTGSAATSSPATSTATLTLSASGTAAPPGAASGTAALSLTAAGASAAAPTATASLTLTGAGTAQAMAAGTAVMTLTGAGTATSSGLPSAAGTLTLSAAGASKADITGSASIVLTASGTQLTAASGAGFLSLTGTATAAGPGTATGTAQLTLNAAAIAAGRGAVSGAAVLTLTGFGQIGTPGGTLTTGARRFATLTTNSRGG